MYHKLGDFGTLVYTVGDGVDGTSIDHINDLSRENALIAADITVKTRDALLYIAGGNGGSGHGRNATTLPKGSLPEADRMRAFIEADAHYRNIPIITDCDPEFKEMFRLEPSHNTPENGRNAAAVFDMGKMKTGEIIAERIHSNRVLATLLHALRSRYVDPNTLSLSIHPVDAKFESTNDQWHIRNKTIFRLWNAMGWAKHLVEGKVDRKEVMSEFLTCRNFGKYRSKEL